MARVFTDGAESGDVLFWSTTDNLSNATDQVGSGSRSYKITANTAGQTKTFTAISEGYFRIRFRSAVLTSANDFLAWRSGGTQLGKISVNTTTRKIEIRTGSGAGTLRATGTTVLSNGIWYLLQVHVKIDDSGIIEVKLEGIDEVSWSGDTKPGAETTVDTLYVTTGTGASGYWMDDLALNDTTGLVDNSWCGDGKVYALAPGAAGDVTQLTPSAGNNYACVDEVPSNGDTDYVSSGTAGQYDLYNVATYTLAAGESVGRVYVESRSREESATGDKVDLGLKTNSNEYWTAAGGNAVTTVYKRYVGDEYRVNPQTGSAWTQGELDALQVGVKVV